MPHCCVQTVSAKMKEKGKAAAKPAAIKAL